MFNIKGKIIGFVLKVFIYFGQVQTMKAEYAFGPFTLTAQWSSHDLQTEFTWFPRTHHHLCTIFLWL